MSTPEFSAAVIGAGPAGLAAAHRLRRQGAAVDVYEAEPGVGGRTRTDRLDGWRVDAATQLFASEYTSFLQVLREAGAGALRVRSPGRDALWRRGRAHEVVYGSPASMLASGALPLGLKFRMGTTYLPFLQRHAAALDVRALPRAAAAGLDVESIAAWGEREMGPGFVELLAAPMLATLYGARPDEVSAGFYHALARQGTGLEVLALRGGACGFCDAVAAALEASGGRVRTGCRVVSLEPAGGGVRLSGHGWTQGYDAAVVAVPAPAAAGLIQPWTRGGAETLHRVRTRAAVTAAFLLHRPAGVRWFGLSFAGGSAGALGAACVGENKGAGLVPEGKGLLTAFVAPGASERLAEEDDAAVVNALLPELSTPFPRLDRYVLHTRVYRWPHGWTIPVPGSLGGLDDLAALPGGGVPVALAGDYLVAPNVEGAVVSGLRAADRVAPRLQ